MPEPDLMGIRSPIAEALEREFIAIAKGKGVSLAQMFTEMSCNDVSTVAAEIASKFVSQEAAAGVAAVAALATTADELAGEFARQCVGSEEVDEEALFHIKSAGIDWARRAAFELAIARTRDPFSDRWRR